MLLCIPSNQMLWPQRNPMLWMLLSTNHNWLLIQRQKIVIEICCNFAFMDARCLSYFPSFFMRWLGMIDNQLESTRHSHNLSSTSLSMVLQSLELSMSRLVDALLAFIVIDPLSSLWYTIQPLAIKWYVASSWPFANLKLVVLMLALAWPPSISP